MKTVILAAALAAPLAHAHITVEPASAPAGAYQKLTFKVGHGCAGSATTGISVQLPEGAIGAKPMPKTGWTITTADGKLAVPIQSHGATVTSTVREVSWKGGPLPDAWYDEFSLQVKLPATPGKLYFKVAQVCEKGRTDWIDLPAASGAASKTPAPAFEVLAPAAGAHQH
jgi:uncharacterized protein YcnI